MESELVIHTRLTDRPDNEQLDPFCLERPLEWRNLEALLKASYKAPQKRIDVRYIDEDGDMIIISSQDELDEAVRLSQQSQKALVLEIRSMEPHFLPAETRPSAPPSEDKLDEKLMLDTTPEEETASTPTSPIEETKPFMVPGALSGANVVAIEIPDCPVEGHAPCELETETEQYTRQGTEAAEPAETLETGEVAPKLRRDEETGYWIVKKLKKTLHLQSPKEKAGSVDEHQAMSVNPLEQPSTASLSKAGKRHRLAEDFLEDEAVEGLPYEHFVLYLEKMKEDLIRKFPHKTAKEVIRRLETKHLIPSGSVAAVHKKSHDRSSVIHKGVICDICEKVIVGIRFKCGNCVNYNLCENCEAQPEAHNSDHVFLKLRRPCAKALSLHAPILGCSLYSGNEECLDAEVNVGKKGELEKLSRKADKLKRLEIKNKEKLRRKEEKLRWKKEQILAQERISHLKTPDSFGILRADFVSDVTLPDYCVVKPGEFLTKTWCMENGGSIPWPRKTVLRMISSNMEAVAEEIDVPPLLPGERTDLTVQLVAPMEPGKYESHWRLFAEDVMFGHIVYCIIEVVQEMSAVVADATRPLETPASPCTAEDKVEMQEPASCPLACVFNEYENSRSTQKQKPTLPLICIEEEIVEQAASGACRTEVMDNAAKHKSDNPQSAEPSCAELHSHPPAASENAEQPERLERPLPAIAKQPDEDRDFWSKRFTGMSAGSEPSTPNNTPLDVSPPPERTIHFPEPELLTKLSLQVLDSSVVHNAREHRCNETLTTTMVDANIEHRNPFEVLVERSAQGQEDAGNAEGEHSPVLGWTFVHEHSPDSSASTASSVEVVTGEELIALDHQQSQHSSIAEYLSKVASLNPSDWQGMHRHAELESLDSFSDDSSSLDEDFFIVKLPDCFDISKPLHTEGCLAPRDDTREQGEVAEDQSDFAGVDAQAEQPSLDDMLKASGTIAAPTLVPTLLPAADAATSVDTAVSVFREDEGQVTDAEAAAAGEYEDAVEDATDDNSPSSARQETSEGSPAESAENAGEARRAEEDADGGASARVSDACEELPFLPVTSDHVDQLVQNAVTVASKAAAQVYKTAKDVFYTLQGRQLQNEGKGSTWKPPECSWTPPKFEWTPPKSEWTPPESKWKPPQSEWKPPASTWNRYAGSEWEAPQEPNMMSSEVGTEAKQVHEHTELEPPHVQAMTRLVEMGFYNKGLNQQLLEKHDGDLDSVLSELLQLSHNDWAESRH